MDGTGSGTSTTTPCEVVKSSERTPSRISITTIATTNNNNRLSTSVYIFCSHPSSPEQPPPLYIDEEVYPNSGSYSSCFVPSSASRQFLSLRPTCIARYCRRRQPIPSQQRRQQLFAFAIAIYQFAPPIHEKKSSTTHPRQQHVDRNHEQRRKTKTQQPDLGGWKRQPRSHQHDGRLAQAGRDGHGKGLCHRLWRKGGQPSGRGGLPRNGTGGNALPGGRRSLWEKPLGELSPRRGRLLRNDQRNGPPGRRLPVGGCQHRRRRGIRRQHDRSVPGSELPADAGRRAEDHRGVRAGPGAGAAGNPPGGGPGGSEGGKRRRCDDDSQHGTRPRGMEPR
mmetsp:Transcript_27207/g.56296  ORF Transcript_27207/g.56296 Transcript_27207/m.56296 type:complete len:336 (+) Transcript_27207:112-1119(+)